MRFTNGWFKQHRDDVIIQLGNGRYELLGLWTYLLAIASRGEVSAWHHGKRAYFPAGTIVTSASQLAASDKKSDLKWVGRMLGTLQRRGLIQINSSREGSIISIVDWEAKYGPVEGLENLEKQGEKTEKSGGRSVSQVSHESHQTEIINKDLTLENDCSILNGNFRTKSTRLESVSEASPIRGPIGEENKNKNIRKQKSVNTLSPTHFLKQENQEISLREKERVEPKESLSSSKDPSPLNCAAPPSNVTADELLQVWNKNRGTLPEAKALTPSRKKAAMVRLREEPDPNYWAEVVRTLANSSFCNGENDRHWRAGFDFLLKPDTHVKATEGAYSRSSGLKLKLVTL